MAGLMDTAKLSWLTSIIGIAGPVLLAGAFFWVVWRTESLHVLVRRLWQLVYGNREISDPEIRAFVDEQTSLVSFRLFAGVSVASLADARSLIQWSRLNDVEMRTLRLCGKYFDPALRQIRLHKLPSRHNQIVRLAGLAVALMFTSACIGNLGSDRALLTLKASQRTFFATATEAKALRPFWPFDAAPLRVTDCSQAAALNAMRTSFTTEEVDALCSVLQSSDTPALLKNAVEKQRRALGLLGGVAAWFLGCCLWAWTSSAAAKSLAARNIDPSLQGSQAAFDFSAPTSGF
jgi:hypothetical protein